MLRDGRLRNRETLCQFTATGLPGAGNSLQNPESCWIRECFGDFDQMLLIHALSHRYIVTWLNIHTAKHCVKRETTTTSHGVNARLHGHLSAQIALLLLARCLADVAVAKLGRPSRHMCRPRCNRWH